jgi:tripeptide aminopeptidase
MRRGASGLPYEHGLTQAAIGVMESLGLKPEIAASFSELYSFQQRGVPAVTIGITEGFDYHTDDTKALIRPLFTGLAQLIGIVEAIDEGACDE